MGQSPPSSHSATPQLTVSTSGLFQGPTSSASDPFAHVNQGPPPQAPPLRALPTGPGIRGGGTPPLGPGVSSVGGASPVLQTGPPTGTLAGPPLAAVPPMPSTSGKFSFQHGSSYSFYGLN